MPKTITLEGIEKIKMHVILATTTKTENLNTLHSNCPLTCQITIFHNSEN